MAGCWELSLSNFSYLHQLKILSLQCGRSHYKGVLRISMRDRSKNRKPLQTGRILSIEAIQTVQALKRAKKDPHTQQLLFDSQVKRLLKLDMMAVLRELLRQNECLLALQVFEYVRKEYWYKPQVSLYADMISVLACNGLLDKVKLLYMCFKMESSSLELERDIEGFNTLLSTLITFHLIEHVMECFDLMTELGYEPDRTSFRVFINGLETKGELHLSAIVRHEAQKYFGASLDFLEKEETKML